MLWSDFDFHVYQSIVTVYMKPKLNISHFSEKVVVQTLIFITIIHFPLSFITFIWDVFMVNI
jgi:hypothetical protein